MQTYEIYDILIKLEYFVGDEMINKRYQYVKFLDICDGDTAYFIIDGDKVKVRFLVIDTPELYPSEKPYAKEAMEFTKNHLENAKKIKLVYDSASLYDDTKEKRLLAWVFVDNHLLNALLVEAGLAWIRYIISPKLKYLNRLYISEMIAIKRNKKLYKRN